MTTSLLSEMRAGFAQLKAHELRDRNIRAAYAVCGITGTAYGMVTAVVAVYLNKVRGIDELTIGELATFFSLGIVALSVPMGLLIKKLSPRTMLSVALLGYATATAVFPFLPSFVGLATARGLDGAFSVGVWVSLETILLMRTMPAHRGLITSLYTIAMATGYGLGSVVGWLIMLAYPMPMVFVGAGILATLAATLAASRLERDLQPIAGGHHEHEEAASAPGEARPAGERPGLGALYWRIKTACVPTFCYGYFQASLVLFLPLFLIEARGVPKEDTSLLVGAFSIGMASSVVFVGRLGDRIGHLKTVRAMTALGVLLTAALVVLPSFVLVAAVMLLAGASLAPIWPLSLALQSLIVDPRDYSRSNALINGSYGLGTLAGPLVSGYIFKHEGGEAMFLHLAALWAIALAATILFRADDPSFRAIRDARARPVH